MDADVTQSSSPRVSIYDRLKLPHGHLTVTNITLEKWGSRLLVDCVHHYPPHTREFRLVFINCRGLNWYVQKSGDEIEDNQPAQLLTHDLGQPGHQHTARLATTLAEVIVSYEKLEIEKAW